MTKTNMALTELLQKQDDGDFLRTVAEAVLQLLMEADVEGADRRRPARARPRTARPGATAIATARSRPGWAR